MGAAATPWSSRAGKIRGRWGFYPPATLSSRSDGHFHRTGMAGDSPGASATLRVTPAWWLHTLGHLETESKPSQGSRILPRHF